MNQVFSHNTYTIKPQGLSIGGKFQVHDPLGEPVLFFDEKVKLFPPSKIIHVYADKKRNQEVLLVKDGSHASFPEFYDVIDPDGNQKIGGIGVDWAHFFTDAWGILDMQGTVIAQVRETSTGRGILHELTDGLIPQKINILIDGLIVAELRQKSAVIGHHLLVDFSKDATGRLDRRLSLATAFLIACHQRTTEAV
jgi:hypothetical protein